MPVIPVNSNKPRGVSRDISWLIDNTFWTHEEKPEERPESFLRHLDGNEHTLKHQTRTDLDVEAETRRLDGLALEESDMNYGYDW